MQTETTTRPTWADILTANPKLSWVAEYAAYCCKTRRKRNERHWWQYERMRREISHLVGWEAPGGSSEAYEVALMHVQRIWETGKAKP